MSADSHPIRNGIVIGVASALIVTVLLWIASFVPALWDPLKPRLAELWSVLTYRVSTPVWVLALLVLAIIPGLVIPVKALRQPREPGWHQYLTDEFHGVRWRWQYGAEGKRLSDLAAYCPKDDTLLLMATIGFKTYLHCETCQGRWGPLPFIERTLYGAVRRQIDRKIRTGDWKSTMERAS